MLLEENVYILCGFFFPLKKRFAVKIYEYKHCPIQVYKYSNHDRQMSFWVQEQDMP